MSCRLPSWSQVYAWGRTIQCGLGDESSTMDDVTLVPTVVTGLLGIKVAAVACGAGERFRPTRPWLCRQAMAQIARRPDCADVPACV